MTSGSGGGSPRRRTNHVVTWAAVAAAAVAIGASTSASARTAADDLAVNLVYTALVASSPAVDATDGLSFTIQPFLSWDGGAARESFTLTITLPPDVHWGKRAPAAPNGCTHTEDAAVCTQDAVQTEGTNIAATFGIWDVVATGPGGYVFRAAITNTARPDPKPDNNNTSLTVTVRNVTRSVITFKPARPRAGAKLAASLRLWMRSTDHVFPVSSGSARCSATAGTTKLATTAVLDSGRATCAAKTPASARGKTLRGTIVATSGGLRLVRSFSVRLA